MHPENEYALLIATMEKGEYESAIRISERFIKTRGERDLAAAFTTKIDAQIALGRVSDALRTALDYHRYCEEFSKKHFPITGNVLLAYLYWLNGRRDDAIRTIIDEIEGLRSRKLSMADGSGGAGLGTMLLYYALTHGDGGAKKTALEWLKQVLSKRRATNWPGPIARYVLGETDIEGALATSKDLIGATLDEVIATARRPNCRYEAHEVLFDIAVKARLDGDEDEARRWFSLLASMPKCTSSDIQYLAAMEVSAFPSS